jgi:predicted GH43/DUF377 family glycosyl hydrolase
MAKDKGAARLVRRRPEKIVGDASRVITRLHIPEDQERIQRIIARVIGLSAQSAETLLAKVMADFADRHKNIEEIFDRNVKHVSAYLLDIPPLSATQKLLIGAYFTMEYAIEAAALFNPSIVPHPDQTNLPDGSLRFIMSLRATGEGHLSSIVFRTGVLDAEDNFILEQVSRYVITADVHVDPLYDRDLFYRKLGEMGADDAVMRQLLGNFDNTFNYGNLQKKIATLQETPLFPSERQNNAFEIISWLANSNYDLTFDPTHLISERVIFPTSKAESRGIEDARFVRFIDTDGEITYYATYTAYNGVSILPQLIMTKAFAHFKISTLNGDAVQNKGMALFPRKVQDRYVMLSRQDGENNYIMFSDNIHFWQSTEIIQEPTRTWEFIQLGNCGSPLETDAGWLVLTHGVGAMRQYCIGAILLDLENPAKLIGYLEDPLIVPNEQEREGYVPNVLYSCGSLIHNKQLVIPYAMSDSLSGIATVDVDALIDCMHPI